MLLRHAFLPTIILISLFHQSEAYPQDFGLNGPPQSWGLGGMSIRSPPHAGKYMVPFWRKKHARQVNHKRAAESHQDYSDYDYSTNPTLRILSEQHAKTAHSKALKAETNLERLNNLSARLDALEINYI